MAKKENNKQNNNEAKKKPAERRKLSQTPRQHIPFFGVLALFAGFSVYALASFFTSTNSYIESAYVSVIDSGSVPVDCQTCPAFDICAPLCGEADSTYEIFADVTSEHENAEAIEYLMDNGIINGYKDGTFKPSATINRAELLTILVTAVGADITGPSLSGCFSDVNEEWFATFVCYAKNAGWVSGYPDGSYKPGNPVIKAEALKITMEAIGLEPAAEVADVPFGDMSMDDWFIGYAEAAKQLGIVSGAVFDASHVMTRADFAQMIYDSIQAQ